MRIADNMTFDQIRGNLSKNRGEMSELQTQAATQKRVTKPSDDPVAAARVLAARVDLMGNTQFLKNLQFGKAFLEFGEQSLGEVTEHLMRLKELALSQSSDASASAETRRAVAAEVRQIYEQVIQVANRKLGDRYVFGGYKTDNPPFNYIGAYRGDDGEMMVGVDKSAFVAVNVPGSQVFLGQGLSQDGVTHVTSTQAMNVKELREQIERAKAPPANSQPSLPADEVSVRGPAAESNSVLKENHNGIDIFEAVKKLEEALNANDKLAVQDSIERLDQAQSQVVLTRAQIGARASVLNTAMGTLEKQKVEASVAVSQLEDADIFKVISDMNKTESQLQATLQTSGKIMMPSLMDFIR